mgnify:CR=1 FL=1
MSQTSARSTPATPAHWPSVDMFTLEELQEELDQMVGQGVLSCTDGKYSVTSLGRALHRSGLAGATEAG